MINDMKLAPLSTQAVGWCVIMAFISPACAENELHRIGEAKRPAMRLVSADSDDGYAFESPSPSGTVQTIPSDAILRWGEPVRPPLKPFIMLSDGSELILERASHVVGLENDRLGFQSELFGEVFLPIDSIRAIVLSTPREDSQRDQLTRQLATANPGQDELVLQSGDVLRGRLIEIESDLVQFSTGGRERAIARELVAMIVLDPQYGSRRIHQAHAIIGLRDGHQLLAESISLDRDLLEIELFDGTVLKAKSYVRPVEDQTVSFIQPLGPHLLYLSDLEPCSYKHIPYLSVQRSFGLDRDIHGRLLVTAESGRRGLKGIAMHSTSRLTFDVPGAYSRFESELSLAANAAGTSGGSVVYRVFLKKETIWEEVFVSPIVRQSPNVIACGVDLGTGSSKASAISLVVDFADRADQSDHALWMDARLVR